MGASSGSTTRHGMTVNAMAADLTIAFAMNSSGVSDSPAAESTFAMRLFLYSSMGM